MKIGSQYWSVGLLLLTLGPVCAFAQDSPVNLQDQVTNAAVSDSQVSAQVVSQRNSQRNIVAGQNVESEEMFAASPAAKNGAFSDSLSFSPQKTGSLPVDNENEAPQAEFGITPAPESAIVPESRFGIAHTPEPDIPAEPEPQAAPLLLLIEDGAGENIVHATIPSPGVPRRIVNDRLNTMPSVSVGEFPDSTRQIVPLNPPLNLDPDFLSFTPSVLIPAPDFDKSVEPHYSYGAPLKAKNGIRLGLKPVLQQKNKKSQMYENELITSQSLDNQLPGGFTGSQPNNLQPTDSQPIDPLLTSPTQ